MGHDHGHAGSAGSAAARHRRPLVLAFALTAAFAVVEFVVGVSTSSLALISDAAHMGTDVIALGMSIAAISLAARPPRRPALTAPTGSRCSPRWRTACCSSASPAS